LSTLVRISLANHAVVRKAMTKCLLKSTLDVDWHGDHGCF
jgi:hypothetical protein